MSTFTRIIASLALSLLTLRVVAADSPEKEKTWSDYLSDVSSGSVSAAGILSISGDSIANVESVKDIVVAAKGLAGIGSDGTLAISITPARTTLTPMSLDWYASSAIAQLLGSTTLGAAQGETEVEGSKYTQRAISVETSYIFSDSDDSVRLASKRIENKEGACKLPFQHGGRHVGTADAAAAHGNQGGVGGPAPEDPAATDKLEQASAACLDEVQKDIRWNRTMISVSAAKGWIKPKSDDGDQHSLGTTVATTFTWGFDGWDWGEKHLGLTGIYRQTWSEPVLASLNDAHVNDKDSSLWIAHLSGGSKTLRVLAELSDARSHDITSSQRAFKQAFGIDARLLKDTWVNFRIGRQRSVDGKDTDMGSILSLSYSPTQLLN